MRERPYYRLIAGPIALLVAFTLSPLARADDAADQLAAARALHAKMPVFLGYCVFHPEQFQAAGGRQSDLAKLDAAGVRTMVVSIGFGYGSAASPYFRTGPRGYTLPGSDEWFRARQLKRIDELVATIKACPRTRLVRTAKDLEVRGDTIGVIVHLIGNNHTLELKDVDTFFERGVRASHPAFQYHDRWCAGYLGREAPAITDFGRKVVARMNELGIVVDTAHASDESAEAILDASVKPINDTHTTSRDFVPRSRGLRDTTLKRIAQSGGVVGVHLADHMVNPDAWRDKYGKWPVEPRVWKWHQHVFDTVQDPEERIRLRNDVAKREQFYRQQKLPAETPIPGSAATIGDVANTVDYLVKVVGIEHVGIGGDVNGIDDDQWPKEMRDVSDLPRLTAELLRRGYTEAQLRKLWSDNWRRVYSKCLPRE